MDINIELSTPSLPCCLWWSSYHRNQLGCHSWRDVFPAFFFGVSWMFEGVREHHYSLGYHLWQSLSSAPLFNLFTASPLWVSWQKSGCMYTGTNWSANWCLVLVNVFTTQHRWTPNIYSMIVAAGIPGSLSSFWFSFLTDVPPLYHQTPFEFISFNI